MLSVTKLITPEGEIYKVRREAVFVCGCPENINQAKADTHHVYLSDELDKETFLTTAEVNGLGVRFTDQTITGAQLSDIQQLSAY